MINSFSGLKTDKLDLLNRTMTHLHVLRILLHFIHSLFDHLFSFKNLMGQNNGLLKSFLALRLKCGFCTFVLTFPCYAGNPDVNTLVNTLPRFGLVLGLIL